MIAPCPWIPPLVLATLPWMAPLSLELPAQEPRAQEPRAAGDGEEVTYANPELLVSTEWLVEHLDDPGLRVVDVREAEGYAAGHLPGALHVPRSATFAPEGPRSMVGPPEQIAAVFGKAGVDAKVHVVLYDEGKSTAAPRVFWTLEYYGHPRVSVLDGGLAKWLAEDGLVTREVPAVEPAKFVAKPVAERLSTQDEVLEALDQPQCAVLDARSTGEYTGATARGRAGHVPGAVHVEWTRNFTEDEVPVFKSAAALTALYGEAGLLRDKRVHVY